MIDNLLHMTFLFWIVLDPLGNVPIFVGILRHFDPRKQRKIIWREMLISLGVMVLFLFFGEGFFALLNVSQSSLQIAGGIILFIIAIRMIFAHPRTGEVGQVPKDPLIVPLAIPAVAGPAILATLTLYGGSDKNNLLVLLALFIAWVASVPILLFSSFLKNILGENGLTAIERLFGYVIILIAAQMALTGFVEALL